ncbi:UDP-N-acetylmuramoyl-L-alanyl-D-glutamate--2,6-diaminopimelate ligase [Cellulomonas endophytica]|uniref:UDP-N-acetylmuramoyl-L-alanyl-D-glutamate--2, 6-diaminopimelate ligase n=1 Tax=Cellulomonas endophytica TaxID=2494735 RepID=UPI0010132D9A|nr:UDP-N-acetylmuramoyl-L-alanyl-D-glutamate--2,6-diaminopimelate ligase [Cellulomonas endophytica]
MTSPQGRLRPHAPQTRRVTDLAAAFGLAAPHGVPDGTAVSGVTVSSSDTLPGDLFVAVQGLTVHGAAYAGQAVEHGAVAVLTDAAGARRLEGEGLAARTVLLVADDPRGLAGPVAAWVHGDPARSLVTVGVTGTNGKTTTSWFVDAALRAVHPVTAVLGTVELRIGEEAVESPRTTVEAPVLQAILARAVEAGAGALTTEVSSHALALGRVDGLRVDVAAFTNLQRDHLDFHGDMEGYYAAKARLFTPELARRGVVVVDDAWGRRLAEEAPIPVWTVATHAGAPECHGADWAVRSAEIGLDGVGSSFVLRGPDGREHAAASPLPGLVNVSNAALAVVTAHAAGVPLATAISAVAAAGAVPGRMERVVERGDGLPLCLVDYAHTPDALTLALEAVRPITPGRLLLVLGSDGDRDRGKRPLMGEIAARGADVVVVTDENPRSEDPATIRAAILEGVAAVRPDGRDVHEATDRRQALLDAVAMADEADTVLVTGKGHEPTQEIAGVFHRYNDRDVYLEALARHRAAAGSAGAGRRA